MGLLWRGKHTFKGNVHFGGGVTGAIPNLGGGRAFYVNAESDYGPSASDGHAGTDPNMPLATITTALGKCEARRNDYIFVLGSYQTDTFPITPAARNVHIIGLGGGGMFQSRALLDGQDESAFQLDTAGGGLELAGLRLGSSGAGDPVINLNTDFWALHMHDCTIGLYMAGTDGIYGSAGVNAACFTIEDNLFGTALTGDCIELGVGHQLYILRNLFMEYGGVGCKIGTMAGGAIISNRFSMTADFDAGDAITLGSGSTAIFVDDNRAAEDGAAAGTNPYSDATTASAATLKNAWAVNWNGDAVTYPAATG